VRVGTRLILAHFSDIEKSFTSQLDHGGRVVYFGIQHITSSHQASARIFVTVVQAVAITVTKFVRRDALTILAGKSGAVWMEAELFV
jgi:hypothetical protein